MKLSPAQAEVINELVSDGYHQSFLASDVFTGRNNADNARRRTLTALITKGAIVKTGSTDIDGFPVYVVTVEAISAAQPFSCE